MDAGDEGKWEALLISESPTLNRVKTLWQIGLDLRQDAFQTREENLLAVVALRSSEYRNRTAQSREKIFAEKLSILRKNTVLVCLRKEDF